MKQIKENSSQIMENRMNPYKKTNNMSKVINLKNGKWVMEQMMQHFDFSRMPMTFYGWTKILFKNGF